MTTMPIKIFDAADGLRLSALMTAYPKTAITMDGPKTAISMIETISIVSAHCMFLHPLMIDPAATMRSKERRGISASRHHRLREQYPRLFSSFLDGTVRFPR